MPYIRMLLPAGLLLVILLHSLQTNRAKKRLGQIHLRGYPLNGISLLYLWTIVTVMITFAAWAPYVLAALAGIPSVFNGMSYLGQHGLVTKRRFIPREEILGYRWSENRKNTVVLLIAGIPEGLRLQIGRVPGGGTARDALERYFAHPESGRDER